MMSCLDAKCRRLHEALLNAPEYLALPHQDRASCKVFMPLAIQLDSDDPPDSAEMGAAYRSALTEAQKLAEEGRLTLDLTEDDDPDSGALESNTEVVQAHEYKGPWCVARRGVAGPLCPV